MKRVTRKQSDRKGFTLIEMLVVLAILVLLMSLVGPRILKSRDKADINTTKSQIGMLEGSLESYALDMRTYPATEQGLLALVEKSSDDDSSPSWAGPYITKSKLPKDPWGRGYQYEFPPTHGLDETRPDIWSLGPDGEDNTEDDVVNWDSEEGDEEVVE